MAVLLSPPAKQQFTTNSGALASGYKLYTYAAGTANPQTTYTTRAGDVANPNPIILDGRGEATIYLAQGLVYDYVLKTGTDVTVWTRPGVTASTPATPILRKSVEIIAHRGFVQQAPQNTLIAFSTALKRGAHSLECDVQPSADGILYVFHDDSVGGLTTGSGTFTALSSTYIDTLKFKSTAGTFLADTRITRFDALLAFVAEKGIELHAEIKNYRTSDDIALFVQAVVDAGLTEKVWLHSNKTSDLQIVRQLNSQVGIGLVASTANPAVYEPAISLVAGLGGAMVTWDYTSLLSTPAIVEYAKSRDCDVAAWTVNNQENMKKLMQIGVRKIMTDVSLEGVS